MPKIDMPNWHEIKGGAHPLTGQDDGPYTEKTLSKLAGLTDLGVRMEKLPPGSSSSHRHWHETEDEFLLMLSGELVLIEDTETILKAGDCAAWKAGLPVAHCLKNKSEHDATYLIVGANKSADRVTYPDHDVVFSRDESGRKFTRLDGSPIKEKSEKISD